MYVCVEYVSGRELRVAALHAPGVCACVRACVCVHVCVRVRVCCQSSYRDFWRHVQVWLENRKLNPKLNQNTLNSWHHVQVWLENRKLNCKLNFTKLNYSKPSVSRAGVAGEPRCFRGDMQNLQERKRHAAAGQELSETQYEK